jgi:hypothetical protein
MGSGRKSKESTLDPESDPDGSLTITGEALSLWKRPLALEQKKPSEMRAYIARDRTKTAKRSSGRRTKHPLSPRAVVVGAGGGAQSL